MDYILELNSANAEFKAYESYVNFSLFLNDENEVAMEGTFGDTVKRIKDFIIRFFTKLWEAIKNFFLKIFGQEHKYLHHEAVGIIVPYLTTWESKLSSIKTKMYKSLEENDEDYVGSKTREAIVAEILLMKSECDEMNEKVTKVISTKSDKSAYKIIDKHEFDKLTMFIEKAKGLCLDITKGLEKNTDNVRFNTDNSIEKNIKSVPLRINQKKYTAQITEIASLAGYIESHTISIINKCVYGYKFTENQEALPKPIELVAL